MRLLFVARCWSSYVSGGSLFVLHIMIVFLVNEPHKKDLHVPMMSVN